MPWWAPWLSCLGRRRGPAHRRAPAGRRAPRPAAGREGAGVRNTQTLANPNGIPAGFGPHLLLQRCRTSPWLHSPQKEKHLKVSPAKLLRKGLPAFCETSIKTAFYSFSPGTQLPCRCLTHRPPSVPLKGGRAGGARPLAHHATAAPPRWQRPSSTRPRRYGVVPLPCPATLRPFTPV